MLMVDSELDVEKKSSTANSVLAFCKMQALGNDFVVVSQEHLEQAFAGYKCASEKAKEKLISSIARNICRRNFGVGADGLIVVRPGSKHDRLSWTYLNSDGSSSLMCGNGLRCLALWAEEHACAPSKNYFVETGKGLVEINFDSPNSITSDLGEPILEANLIPADLSKASSMQNPSNDSSPEKPILGTTFEFDSEIYRFSCVNMGNPHCVIFELGELNEKILERKAKLLQSHPFFPEGVNVEFVLVESRKKLRVIVFERGCGRTLACASGAAAVLVAAVLEGKADRNATVQLDGGSLHLSWSEKDNHVRINGPASIVFKGQIDLSSLSLASEIAPSGGKS